MNKNLLLTQEEYNEFPDEIKNRFPYIFEIGKEHQILCYFGAKHLFDKSNEQFNILHEQWLKFLQNQNAKKIVLREGNVAESQMSSLEEAIEKYGESGAIVFWAKEAGVLNIRPEPTIEYEATELLKNFTKEDLFYFYMIRGIVTWQKKTNREEFGVYIERNIKRYKEVLDWSDFSFSFEEIIPRMHKKIFNKEFTLDDKDFLMKIPSPTCHESYINDLSRKSLVIRDYSILDTIEKYWKEGYSIFVVYGLLHAKMEERAIRAMIDT